MTLREKIMDAAFDLFGEQGFEKTTLSQIIKRAGTSKGGFYHHFESKQAILEAITLQYVKTLGLRYEGMLSESNQSTKALLNNVFETINHYKKEQVEDYPKLKNLYAHADSHVVIGQMADAFEKLTTSIYLKLILKGMDEGLFQVTHPEHLAGLWSREMLRIYGLAPSVILSDNPTDLDQFTDLVEFVEGTINKALGFDHDFISIKDSALAFVISMRQVMQQADHA